MDDNTFRALVKLSGLKLSENHAEELQAYTRQLFASLKPGKALGDGDNPASESVGRIFGRVRSIDELDLAKVEPSTRFTAPYRD